MEPDATPSSARDLHRTLKANQRIFEALEKSKALTDAIVDELPIALALLNAEHKLLKLNAAGQRIFRRDQKSVLGLPVSALLPETTAAKLAPYLERTGGAATSARLAFEDTVVVGDSPRFFHWEVGRVSTDQAHGGDVHVLIGNDITEARVAIEQLTGFRKDLEVARAVQEMLIVDGDLIQGAFYDMIGYCKPARQVGGDLWWHTEIPGVGLFSIVADVTSHGIGPAMVASHFAGMLAATLNRHPPTKAADVMPLVVEIGRLAAMVYRGDYFIAYGAVVVLQTEPRAIVFGGGFPWLLNLPRQGDPELIKIRGNPLGSWMNGEAPHVFDIPFAPGDRLVAFTDGCYETPDGNTLTLRRQFIDVLIASRELPLKPAKAAVVSGRAQEGGTGAEGDDVTFVMLDRKG